MRIYSYILAKDSGFAPNPFWGVCTLACCKPAIRRRAVPGDWVVGISPKKDGHVLRYAMQVDKVLPLEAYFLDDRFQSKRPDMKATELVCRCGDNIYRPSANGGIRQLPSQHSEGHIVRDLSGRNVLVARSFSYFGARGFPLPPELDFLVVGRGHKCRFTEEQIASAAEFLNQLPRGVLGPPSLWKAGDPSWEGTCR